MIDYAKTLVTKQSDTLLVGLFLVVAMLSLSPSLSFAQGVTGHVVEDIETDHEFPRVEMSETDDGAVVEHHYDVHGQLEKLVHIGEEGTFTTYYDSEGKKIKDVFVDSSGNMFETYFDDEGNEEVHHPRELVVDPEYDKPFTEVHEFRGVEAIVQYDVYGKPISGHIDLPLNYELEAEFVYYDNMQYREGPEGPYYTWQPKKESFTFYSSRGKEIAFLVRKYRPDGDLQSVDSKGLKAAVWIAKKIGKRMGLDVTDDQIEEFVEGE